MPAATNAERIEAEQHLRSSGSTRQRVTEPAIATEVARRRILRGEYGEVSKSNSWVSAAGEDLGLSSRQRQQLRMQLADAIMPVRTLDSFFRSADVSGAACQSGAQVSEAAAEGGDSAPAPAPAGAGADGATKRKRVRFREGSEVEQEEQEKRAQKRARKRARKPAPIFGVEGVEDGDTGAGVVPPSARQPHQPHQHQPHPPRQRQPPPPQPSHQPHQPEPHQPEQPPPWRPPKRMRTELERLQARRYWRFLMNQAATTLCCRVGVLGESMLGSCTVRELLDVLCFTHKHFARRIRLFKRIPRPTRYANQQAWLASHLYEDRFMVQACDATVHMI